MGWGLEILRVMNECLLLKWWWRYAVELDSLWKRVISARYGDGVGDWVPNIENGHKVSRVWDDILGVVRRCLALVNRYYSSCLLMFEIIMIYICRPKVPLHAPN